MVADFLPFEYFLALAGSQRSGSDGSHGDTAFGDITIRAVEMDRDTDSDDGDFHGLALPQLDVGSAPAARGLWDENLLENLICPENSLARAQCNASPAADAAPPLLLLDATLTLASTRGERSVSIHDFILSPRKTVLQGDEILKEIFIPQPAGRRGATYLKLGQRKAMEIAIVGVGVAVYLNGSDRDVTECRIAMASVAPTPLRARKGEEILKGREISDHLIEEAAEVAAEEASPISDVRAGRQYRLDMIRVLCRQATRTALARARGNKVEGLS